MAPKRKGMSLQEKRDVIQNIFTESKSVFQLKEIEKIGQKRGVTLPTIKDVLQSLVDDDLVNTDKIGISNFFWSFPSEVSVKLGNEEVKAREKLKGLEKEEESLVEKIEQEKNGKEDCEEREELEKKNEALKSSIQGKKRELEAYSANDPERFEELKKMKMASRDGANRWVDNIFSMQGWMKKKFVGMEKQINQLFVQEGVPVDMDYIE